MTVCLIDKKNFPFHLLHWYTKSIFLSQFNLQELDILSLADENGKLSERNKRTIDILRQLFPTISQVRISQTEKNEFLHVNFAKG